MSYDFHLLHIVEGRDAAEQARAYLQSFEQDEPSAGPPDPAKEGRKQALAAALRATNPELEPFALDYGEIARLEEITEAEARERYRQIELNGPEDDGQGIQIELFDDDATVTVPYWHHGAEAEPVFAEIWRYLSVLEREGGYRTYDPQLERVLDLERDRAAVLEAYARGLAVTYAAAKKLIEPKRPWWRFW